MHVMYQLRGYRTLVVLLGLQGLAFAGLLLLSTVGAPAASSAGTSNSAQWVIRNGAVWATFGALAVFSARTWGALSEAIHCLDLVRWQPFLKYALHPLLYLAPAGLIATDVLREWRGTEEMVILPGALVSAAGLLVCLLGVLDGLFLIRMHHRMGAAALARLEDLKREYGAPAVQRLADSVDYANALVDRIPLQMRRGFTLADLPASPWYDRSAFPWACAFEQSFAEIRPEALQVFAERKLEAYAYPGAVDGGWNVFWLVRNDEVVKGSEAKCPVTLRALRSVPGFPMFREAHFSILEPGSRILPHCDSSNVWVTAHLGIQIPKRCGLRVGREARRWCEGEFLFFDTSYQHEAWNDSDTPRIVLLFDFLHHELSPAERSFFSRRAA